MPALRCVPFSSSRTDLVSRRKSGRSAGWQHDIAVRIDQSAAPRGQAVQELRARPVGQAEVPPARPIAIDGDATIARIGPARRTVRDRIDKQQRIALFEMAFDGTGLRRDRFTTTGPACCPWFMLRRIRERK